MTRLAAAIIAAYGPTAGTKKALSALRAQVGSAPIFVYAGNRAGIEAVTALARATGVTVIGESGAIGLVQALVASPDGPVLLAHDDVHFGPQMVARMLRAHVPDKLIVPFLDTIGIDQSLGRMGGEPNTALRNAAAKARRDIELHTVEPAVVLASRQVLLRHGARRHIAAPGTVISAGGLDFQAVAGSVAAHTGHCRAQPVPAAALGGRPLLVATLIVRDEEHMLPDCLGSLHGVVDEIVVCDTGSVDRTVQVAEAVGARVIHREWRNDFAWARNEALDAAGNPWYALVLDADERLECPDPQRLRDTLARSIDEHRLFKVEVGNAGVDGAEVGNFLGTRIFRADEARYIGALHEQPTARPGLFPLEQAKLDGLRLLHVGYDAAVASSRDKNERNLNIARTAYEENPSPQTALNYARSLHASPNVELQRKLLEEVLAYGTSVAMEAFVLTMLAQLDFRAGDPESALERTALALEKVPADDTAAAVFGEAAEELGRFDVIAEKARWRRGRPSPPPAFAMHDISAETIGREAVARARCGDLDGAISDAHLALSIHRLSPHVWKELAEAVLTQRPDNVLELLGPLVDAADGDTINALVPVLPPLYTAELAVRVVQSGKATADSVRNGLLAAVLNGRSDLVAQLLTAVELVDPPVLESIAQRAETKGFPEIAGLLRPAMAPRLDESVPLRTALPRAVLFLLQHDADERVLAAVERCVAEITAQGWTAVRHVSPDGGPYARAVLPDGIELPLADASGITEALQPAAIVFCSMTRFGRDARSLLFHPSAAVMLLVPASPFGSGDVVDAVAHPDDPGVGKVLLDLLQPAPAPAMPAPAGITHTETIPGLTSIVIDAQGSLESLTSCLESLARHTRRSYEVVLIDGPDGEALRELEATGTLRRIQAPSAAARVLNAGIGETRGEYVCLLDAAYEVLPGWLDALLETLALDGTGAVGPRFDQVAGFQKLHLRDEAPADLEEAVLAWTTRRRDSSWQVSRLAGACFMTSRAMFEELGGLDEHAEPGLPQVDEFCDRLRAVGQRLRVSDGAALVRKTPMPQVTFGTFGWVTRAGARQYQAYRQLSSVPTCVLVLSDGRPALTRRTVQESLVIADRVVVLERGGLLPTELAVRGIVPGSVDIVDLEWEDDRCLPEVLTSLACDRILVLGAGEIPLMKSYEDARAELDATPAGPVRVRVGEHPEVRIHPPTPDAVAHIGGSEGPLIASFRIQPAT